MDRQLKYLIETQVISEANQVVEQTLIDYAMKEAEDGNYKQAFFDLRDTIMLINQSRLDLLKISQM
jgi:hypothetical protein